MFSEFGNCKFAIAVAPHEYSVLHRVIVVDGCPGYYLISAGGCGWRMSYVIAGPPPYLIVQ